jgi:CDP-diacylglycerol--serine O-phosphatidyltransferase
MADESTHDSGRRRTGLPDVVTSLGLLAGCFSLVSAIGGHFERAGWMIGVSIACDIGDGLVARASNRSSRFGLEYDSLSDVIAFGVAPAILADAWALRPLGTWAVLLVAIYIICAALRLARFNIQADEPHGKRRFVGLPVPGAAAAIAGMMFGYQFFGLNHPRALCAFMVVFLPVLAALMVSRMPYPTAKVSEPRTLAAPGVVASAIVALAMLVAAPKLFAFIGGIGYLLSGPFMHLMGERIEQAKAPATEAE